MTEPNGTPTSDRIRELQQAIAGTLDPIRQQLAEIESLISELELELDELRKLRTAARKLLAVTDPEVPIRGRRSAQGATTLPRTHPVAAAKLRAVEDHVRSTYGDGREFTGAEIDESGALPLKRPLIINALNQLHGDGVLRIDHLGQGGRKFFRLVGEK